MNQHQCDRCNKKLSCYKSLWRHKRNGICQGSYCSYGNVSVVGKKRKDGDGKYSMFSDTRFPSMVMSPSCKRQRTKHDIVGYSDDETEEKSKFDGTRKAIIDRIVNSAVKPSPVPSHAISNVPVIPTGVVQKKLESSKGKGLWLRRGRGIDDDNDEDNDEDDDDDDDDDYDG